MEEVKLKEEHSYSSVWEPPDIKEEPELSIKQEPEEVPFHIITVKTEDDEDKSSVLHQRATEEETNKETEDETNEETEEETNEETEEETEEETDESSSDSDHSEDYSQKQVEPKRSYGTIPPDSCETDHRPFSCSDCGKRFLRKRDLETHMMVHTGERPHKCFVCEKSFKQKSHITKHLKHVHHICPVCKTRFPDKNKLNEHLGTHVEEGTLGLTFMKPYSNHRPLSCSKCEKTFRSNSCLRRHLLVHTRLKHKCPLCDSRFKSKAHVADHIRQLHYICPVREAGFPDDTELNEHHKAQGSLDLKPCRFDDEDKSSVLHQRPTKVETDKSSSDTDHSEDYSQEQGEPKRSYAMIPPDSCVTDHRPFSCADCGKRFTRKPDLKTHMMVHTGERPHKCSVCEKSFKQKSHITKHLKHVHHICPVCKTRFPDKVHLNEHLGTHVEEGTLGLTFMKPYSNHRPFSCSDCGKKFRSNSCLQRHLLVHTGLRPHKCSLCDSHFKYKAHVTDHLQHVHHICPVCEAGFADETKLNEHLRSHEEPESQDLRPYSCSECSKRFTNLSTLKRHMFVHSLHKCSVCEKSVKVQHLTRHMRIHAAEKPFRCPICEKGFHQKTNLQKHVQSHSDQTPFVCSVCQKGFKIKYNLNLHMQIHTSEKPFKCSFCEKTFSVKRYLRSHLLMHTAPFVCSVCDKHFTQKSYLKIHMRIHTGERPYRCSLCDKGFKSSSNLSEHVRRHKALLLVIAPVVTNVIQEPSS